MAINKQLLAKIVNQIVSQPETYTVVDLAQHEAVLGLAPEDARYLFSSRRTVSEIHRRTSRLISEDSCGKYDEYGRDRDGYDRDGGDQYGIGRDGYDRYGRDRDGRDRDGYDRDGRDQYGRDRDGYDLDGRDRDGYNRDGRDQYGNPLPPIVVD